jgi:hypothetical protein
MPAFFIEVLHDSRKCCRVDRPYKTKIFPRAKQKHHAIADVVPLLRWWGGALTGIIALAS